MLTLPVSSAVLALVPMFCGAVTVSLAWLATALLVLRPCGLHPPLAWPAAMLVAVLAGLQATVWLPLRLRGLRVLILLLGFPPLIAAGFLGRLYHVPENQLLAFYLALTAGACGLAVGGVWRARHGDEPQGRWLAALWNIRQARHPRHHRRFRSPVGAQLWLEWRRNGMLLPVLMGLWCALASLGPLLAGCRMVITIGEISLNTVLEGVILCLTFLPVMAALSGAAVGRWDAWQRDPALSPFIGVRPVSSTFLTLAKMKLAAMGTLAAWAVLLLATSFWLTLPGSYSTTTGIVRAALASYSAAQIAGISGIGLLLAMALTWSLQVQWLVAGATGRRWIAYGLVPVAPILTIWGTIIVRDLFRQHPEWPGMAEVLPWVATTALLLKLTLAAWAIRVMYHRGLIGPYGPVKILGFWLLGVLGLFAAFLYLLPGGRFPVRYIVLGAMLLAPLARLSLTPLALEWNRHR